ncbi:unnamed protein product, partial [Arctogadus glacialis]
MDDGESLVSMNGTHVSFIGNDCENIPDFLGDTYGQMAKRLDLSFNLLRYVGNFSPRFFMNTQRYACR